MLDWARATGDKHLASLLESRSRDFSIAVPIAYEPSGEDFLSPCMAEADLMRRVLEADSRARSATPAVVPTDGETAGWRQAVSDPTDPKLGHLYGLNLSRAWMLHAIARSLPASDPRSAALTAAARIHGTRE